MENQHLVKQEYDAPAGCLIRLFWMVLGNALLLFCAIAIAEGPSDLFTSIDILFWTLVGSLLVTRYIDIHYFRGMTSGGETATMADFRRYALLLGVIAIGLWIGAHVFSAFYSEALSNAPE